MAFCGIEWHFPGAGKSVHHRTTPAPGVQQMAAETMWMVKCDLSGLLPERVYAD
jgi:hypothetical protein